MSKGVASSLHLTKGAVWLVLASAALMTLWSFVVPIFEAPDEPSHWDYARSLRVNKQLPLYTPFSVEANSPPLYYLVISPIANYSDIPPRLTWSGATGTAAPALPRFYQNSYSDYALYWPIRRTRLVTILISLITVVFCYASGVEAAGRGSTGMLAGSLAAFLPLFTFRGMNVSNDAMVTAASSVATYLLVRIIRRGSSRRLALGCALAMAAAFLSKASALFLPVPFAIAVLTERVTWKEKAKWVSYILISIAAAAPWLIRNQMLYGDPLAKKAMYGAVGSLISEKTITSAYFRQVFPGHLATSFVGVFGWGTVASPGWVYCLYGLVGVLGILGCIYGLVRAEIELRLAVVLASIPLLALVVVIQINLMFDQPQGRYMLPALPAMALLIAMGLECLPFWRRSLAQTLAAGFALMNLYVLIWVVVPAYWPPPKMSFPGGVKTLTVSQPGPAKAEESRLPTDQQEFLVETDATTDQYNFFTFTLSGAPAQGVVTGALYLEFCQGNQADRHRVPFDWVCDGAVHAVIVPLWTYREWGGRLAAVKVKPLDGGETRPGSPTVQFGSIVMVSSITSTRGP